MRRLLVLTLVASVRRRRRELALLKTLGFTHRQLAAVVAWQSTIAVALGADPATIDRIYRAMIDAFIAFERTAFAKKKRPKKAAPKNAKR